MVEDFTLLWVLSRINSLPTRFRNLLVGGVVGGLFQFFFTTNHLSGGIVHPWILWPFVSMALVPFAIVGLTFYGVRISKMVRLFGYFYVLSVLLACIHWGLDNISLIFFKREISLWWHFCIQLMLVLSFAELGWGVVHRQVWDKFCLYPIKIRWDDQQIELKALLDTGNHLCDPLTRLPVVIIDQRKIWHLLPAKLLNLIEQLQRDDINEDFSLPDSWEGRVRLLPFNSIGKEHGLLVGFRPDEMSVMGRKEPIVTKNIVIALHNRPLSPDGAYEALIPSAVLRHSNL